MNSFTDTLLEAIVGRKRFDSHRERLIDRAFVEQMIIKLQSQSWVDRTIGRIGLILRTCSISPTKKGNLVRPSEYLKTSPTALIQDLPSSSPKSPPSILSTTLERSIISLNTPSPSTTPSFPQPFITTSTLASAPFLSPPTHMVGYGRYRYDKSAPREAILAHIDTQLGPISDVLPSLNGWDINIPGYNDITFGDRLRAKDRARTTANPSWTLTPNGTMIHRGFPGGEIVTHPGTRKILGPLRAYEYALDREYFDPGFNPMVRPDTGNSKAWVKIGFTNHALKKPIVQVRRKRCELENLKPMWGPGWAATERLRLERKLARHANTNACKGGRLPVMFADAKARNGDTAPKDEGGMVVTTSDAIIGAHYAIEDDTNEEEADDGLAVTGEAANGNISANPNASAVITRGRNTTTTTIRTTGRPRAPGRFVVSRRGGLVTKVEDGRKFHSALVEG